MRRRPKEYLLQDWVPVRGLAPEEESKSKTKRKRTLAAVEGPTDATFRVELPKKPKNEDQEEE
jgi:hypothetical protein